MRWAAETEEDRYVFKPELLFLDLALNDSLIHPFDLSRPKNISGSAKLSKDFKKTDITVTQKQPDPSSDHHTETDIPKNPRPPKIAKRQIQYPRVVVAPTTSPEPASSISAITQSRINKNAGIPQKLTITKENMMQPIPDGFYASLDIIIVGEKANHWRIVDTSTKQTILDAERDGKLGSFSIRIHHNDDEKSLAAFVSSNFTHRAFVARAIMKQTNLEIAAIAFKSQKKNTFNTRRFDAFISRKGVDIPASSTSVLLKDATTRLQMHPKPPKIKGGIPVLYFGGRVKMQSIKNHILISDEIDGQQLVFGKESENTFIAEIYPPLSPMQGICLSLPHFK